MPRDRRSSIRLRGALAACSGVAVALTTLLSSQLPAAAVSGSTFESTDGDLVVNHGGTDWASYIGSPHLHVGVDKPSGSGDDSLGQGSKDDSTTWTVVSGQIPNNKSDLLRTYVADEFVAGSRNEYLYLSAIRANTLGTTNYSFEINQVASGPVPASGTWTVNRTSGDLLILFNWTQGGGKPTLLLSRWLTGGNAKTVCQASSTVPCWGKTTDLTAGGLADGSVNDPSFGTTVPTSDPVFAALYPNGVSGQSNQVSSLPQDTFMEAAVNLTGAGVTVSQCSGFSRYMVRSRSSASFDSELKDFIAPMAVDITLPPDPTGASANGSGYAARVDDSAVLGASNPATVPTHADGSLVSSQYAFTSTSPSGGSATDSAQVFSANPPVPASVLTAGLLRATSTSTVVPAQASQSSIGEVSDVNVLQTGQDASGNPVYAVHADTVDAAATAQADDRSSGYGAGGSTIQNLVVDGKQVTDVSPGASVSLDDGLPSTLSLTGTGNYVQVNNQSGSTSGPTGSVGTKGTWSADMTVDMIHVHVPGNGKVAPWNQAADITIGHAVAHAQYNGTLCSKQSVSGHALIATENLHPATAGYVYISPNGGSMEQDLNQVNLDNLLSTGTARSLSQGALIPPVGGVQGNSTSTSEAAAQNVCILGPGDGSCALEADLLEAESNSQAGLVSGKSVYSSDAGDTAVPVSINGAQPLGVVAPNTRVDLPGLGYVVLNEQICDNGASLANHCASAVDGSATVNHAGLTVRAVHVHITVPSNPLGLPTGLEIVVCEAHSDATYNNV